MKISFTGTGCSGKSTLLTKCREYYGDKFTYVTEVTRPIARKGLPINEDGNDDTQRAIIDAHIENNKLDDVIMDRCIVDGYVYTTWLFDQEQVTSDIYEYAWNTLNDILNDIDTKFRKFPDKLEEHKSADGVIQTGNRLMNPTCSMCGYKKHCWPDSILHKKVAGSSYRKGFVWYTKLVKRELD